MVEIQRQISFVSQFCPWLMTLTNMSISTEGIKATKTVAKLAGNKEKRLSPAVGTSVFIDFHLPKTNLKELDSQLEPPVTYCSDWSGHFF